MLLSIRHIKMLALALLNLLLGFFNYFLFQVPVSFFDFITLPQHRSFFIQNTTLRHLFTGYFSDITWCCALCLVTIVLAELKHLQKQGKILILLLPVTTEFAQYFHFMRGTFDWYDVLIYVIIVMVFGKFFPSLIS